MSNENVKAVVACGLLLLLVVFVVFGPMFTIWSLNALFRLEIPVNFSTWCAVLWLLTILHGIKIHLKKND
jgi:cobalamin biosynthesis protein CobD/CbiB